MKRTYIQPTTTVLHMEAEGLVATSPNCVNDTYPDEELNRKKDLYGGGSSIWD